MRQHLLTLLCTLPAALGFAPPMVGRNDVVLHAKRGKGLNVPSSAGEARGIGGSDGAGENIICKYVVCQFLIAGAALYCSVVLVVSSSLCAMELPDSPVSDLMSSLYANNNA